MISKDILISAIRNLSLQNKCVCIHSSFRSFGDYIEGGPQAVIETFLEEDCTVMVLTCADMYEIYPPYELRPDRNGVSDYSYFENKKYGNQKIFTIESNDISKDDMGLIPYTLINMPFRQRGYNPLNSFAAVGKNAYELIRGQSAENVFSPLRKLYEMNGYVLLMGVHLDKASIIHYAEQTAGREPFIRWANDLNGNPSICRTGGCSHGFNKFFDLLIPIEKSIMVGKSFWRCFPAKLMTDICAKAMMENPNISHCNNHNCERCNDAVLGGPIWNRSVEYNGQHIF